MKVNTFALKYESQKDMNKCQLNVGANQTETIASALCVSVCVCGCINRRMKFAFG